MLRRFFVEMLAVRSGATITPPGPEPVIPNLLAWYRGDAATAAQLTDRSGNGNHLVQAVAANQASIAFDSNIRNQPAIVFTAGGAGDDFYRCETALYQGANPPAFTEYTVLCVFQKAAAAGDYMLFQGADATAAIFTGPDLFNEAVGGGTLRFACASTANHANSVNAIATWQWALGVHVAGSRQLYVNGVQVGTNAVADSSPAVRKLGMGRSLDAVPFYPLTGRIAEAVIWGSAATPAQRTAIAAYISNRYGL